MKIVVIGGGMMGLVAAEHLVRADKRVTLIDRESQLGGLSTWFDYGDFTWDKFYHVILPSDQLLIDLIRRLGLGSSLVWRQSRTGYFQDSRHYSLSDNIEFLRFPLLSPVQKSRLAWTIVYGSRLSNWRKLENMTSEDWLLKHSGRGTYEAFWRPLLKAKLGNHYREVSAVFIWSYIKRLFSARDPSVGKEQLGHVQGGYRAIINSLAARIEERGEIRSRQSVHAIRVDEDNQLSLIANDREERFDRIIFTGPTTALKRICPEELINVEGDLDRVRYLGVICLVLLTKKQLTPFYVLNISDDGIPFTGVVGMSSVVPKSETGDCFLTYFPKYIDANDAMFERDDDSLLSDFMVAVRRLFPDFEDGDIVGCNIHRARIVQPLQVLNYSRLVPRVQTNHPGLFLLNTGQFVNNTVHNNQVIKIVAEFFEGNADAF